MARASKKVEDEAKSVIVTLEKVQCIHYPLCFWKNIADIRVLINLSSEINTMTPVHALKLGLKAYYTDVGAQKIDGSIF